MGKYREYADNIKSLIEVHPKGSVFCTTSKESGHALDCESLLEFTAAFTEAQEEIKRLREALEKLNCGSYSCTEIARQALETGGDDGEV